MARKNTLMVMMALLTTAGASAQTGGYTGKPYNGPHTIKSSGAVLEAEDFDEGGFDVTYHFKALDERKTKGQKNGYRKDATDGNAQYAPVNGGNSGKVLGNIDGSDWACYTLDVQDAGVYTIGAVGCCDGDAKFHLTIDGKTIARDRTIPNRGWSGYSTVNFENIPLKAGTHILRWSPVGGQNVDKFTFTYTEAYRDIPVEGLWNNGNYTWPMTDTYTNMPLFVKFPSQMFGQEFEGSLWTADPSAHVWASDPNTLYVYASHDMEPNQGCDRMDRYHIFSTQDMKTWTDHGEFLNAEMVNADISAATGLDIKGDGFMWAPDAAYNKHDGLYYFIFPHKQKTILRDPAAYPNDKGEYWLHVLYTSTTPVGPWKYKGYITGSDGSLLPKTIDPCIFTDDDGEAYLYISGDSKGCWAARLNPDDWTKLAETAMKPQTDAAGTLLPTFHEAPFVFKKDGIYYLTHSDGNPMSLGGNKLLYATATSPLGPWTPKGAYMNPHGEDTTHGSIVWFKGKAYQFYHTANYSGAGALRSVCFTEVNVHDGQIDMIENYGKPGSRGVFNISRNGETVIPAEAVNVNDKGEIESHLSYFKRPAGEYFTAFKDRTQPLAILPEGGIADMGVKEWTRYTVNISEAGRYTVTLNARRKQSDTQFSLGLDGVWFRYSEKLTTPLNNWGTLEFVVELPAGHHCLEFRSMKGLMDLKSITFSKGIYKVPGTIEAEDYDDDDYKFQNTKDGNVRGIYRSDAGVALSTSKTHKDGDAPGVNNGPEVTLVSNTSTGDWLKYTFVCTKAGTYDVQAYLASDYNGSGGKFSLVFDEGTPNEQRTEMINFQTAGGWQDYRPQTVKGISLTEGEHVMKFQIGGGLNADRFSFVRTGAITGISHPSVDASGADERQAEKPMYTLAGIRTSAPVDGVVISGGKKILCKLNK